MSLSGNKGEWSEAYVLLKLLGDKELKIGDENMNAIEGLVYPIVKIIRIEAGNLLEFSYYDNLVIISTGSNNIKIPIPVFIAKAKELFQIIKESKKVFEHQDTEEFLNSIRINTLKASSKDKTDITIQIHDKTTVSEPILGFSIKSQLGSPSTLVNASGATNFVFKVVGEVNPNIVNNVNRIKKFSDKLAYLHENNCSLNFSKVDNRIFAANLSAVDSHFDKLLANLLLLYYSNSISSKNTIKQFTNQLSKLNPLDFDIEVNPEIYTMKVKDFLVKYALGMQASKVWDGQIDANGGYIIVKKSGDVICYHFYYLNKFENYLFSNTKFETPSTTRHGFGTIFYDEEYIMKLNLQIRFTS